MLNVYSYGSEDEFDEESELQTEIAMPAEDQPLKNGSCEPINMTFRPGMKQGLLASSREAEPQPIHILKMFFSDENMADIASETNRCAASHFIDREDSNRKRRWSPTSLQEMWDFFCLIIAMGLVKISDLRKYCSTDDLFKYPFKGAT